MRRLRFGSGLILGLVLGIPAGALIALLLGPAPPASDHATTATTLQVQELTRKLEAAKDERQRANTQLEQFQKLAEQMTASFNSLEQRFTALQDELQRRQARDQQAAAPAAPAPPAAARVIPTTPEPAIPAADAAPAPPAP